MSISKQQKRELFKPREETVGCDQKDRRKEEGAAVQTQRGKEGEKNKHGRFTSSLLLPEKWEKSAAQER